MTYIKIATTSFSAASTVNVDNVFSSAYTHYLVVRNFSGSTAGNNANIRLRVSAVDDSGTNYRRQYIDAGSTSISGQRDTGLTEWRYALGLTETTSIGFALLRISNPFDTVRTTAWVDTGYTVTGNMSIDRQVLSHDLATSYTGFSIIPAAGTITGSVTVYGLKES